MFLFRIIVFLIFLLIAAKLFGAVIKVLREIFFPESTQLNKGTYLHTTPKPPVQNYDNVQDADFKDVDDTK